MSKIAILKDDYSFDFDNGWLYKGEEKIIEIKGREADLLRCLCEAPNQYLSFDKISDMVAEMDYAAGKGTRVNGGDFTFFSRETIRPWKANLLNKHEIFRDTNVIDTVRGKGYIYYGQPIIDTEIGEEKNAVGLLPHELTDAVHISASHDNVLFRDEECQQIIEIIKNNQNIVISGMGGIGKTSIARLVYRKLKKDYDCCGWINYNGDLKQSMISAIRIDDYSDETMTENDIQKKWRHLVRAIANSKQSKLLVIDNVDYIEGVQSPLDDNELCTISSWDNITIIITSRLQTIYGYEKTITIENLGDEADSDNCVDLFCYYNQAVEKNKNEEVIKKLCKLADYNTMAIELLAKDSRYDAMELDKYYTNLLKVGFKYADEVPVETDHDINEGKFKDDADVGCSHYRRGNETAASQLMKLFNMKQRSIIERQILWDFHCLPEAERVSRSELKEWFGYTIKDIDKLKEEGWIKYDDGFFYMHPLINQAISCAEENWGQYWEFAEQRRSNEKAPTIVSKIVSHDWFQNDDSFALGIRKIYYADYLSYEGRFLEPEELLYIADYARKRGVRVIGRKYYKISYNKLFYLACEIGCLDEGRKISVLTEEQLLIAKQFWKSTYYYGYMLSYTKSGFDDAETCLSMAAKVMQMIQDFLPEDEKYELMGMSFDHYGYVKSNNHKNELNNFINACMLYRCAFQYRKKLIEKYPDNLSYRRDYAWTLDNLGTLFAYADYNNLIGNKGNDSDLVLTGEDISYDDQYEFFMKSEGKAEEYLKTALAIRIQIAKKKGDNHSTEVAWTCCNIASLLSKYPDRYEDAEKLIFDALSIYQELDKEFPEQHASSMARTYSSYGRLLSKWEGRKTDALMAYKKALDINVALEKEYPGVYIKEIEAIQKEVDTFSKVI